MAQGLSLSKIYCLTGIRITPLTPYRAATSRPNGSPVTSGEAHLGRHRRQVQESREGREEPFE